MLAYRLRHRVAIQDYVVRATAVGNGGTGMEIELIIEKIKV